MFPMPFFGALVKAARSGRAAAICSRGSSYHEAEKERHAIESLDPSAL